MKKLFNFFAYLRFVWNLNNALHPDQTFFWRVRLFARNIEDALSTNNY